MIHMSMLCNTDGNEHVQVYCTYQQKFHINFTVKLMELIIKKYCDELNAWEPHTDNLLYVLALSYGVISSAEPRQSIPHSPLA